MYQEVINFLYDGFGKGGKKMVDKIAGQKITEFSARLIPDATLLQLKFSDLFYHCLFIWDDILDDLKSKYKDPRAIIKTMEAHLRGKDVQHNTAPIAKAFAKLYPLMNDIDALRRQESIPEDQVKEIRDHLLEASHRYFKGNIDEAEERKNKKFSLLESLSQERKNKEINESDLLIALTLAAQQISAFGNDIVSLKKELKRKMSENAIIVNVKNDNCNYNQSHAELQNLVNRRTEFIE